MRRIRGEVREYQEVAVQEVREHWKQEKCCDIYRLLYNITDYLSLFIFYVRLIV